MKELLFLFWIIMHLTKILSFKTIQKACKLFQIILASTNVNLYSSDKFLKKRGNEKTSCFR